MTVYVFDMDGTLTEPRLEMDAKFAKRFVDWQTNNKSFIATGSDYSKVQEQLPQNVIDAFTGIYCSMGNVLQEKDKIIYKNEFIPSEELLGFLEKFRKGTKYPGKLFDNYIENRIGMINFSVLGRNCPYEERVAYNKWDNEFKERIHFQEILQSQFPELDIAVGGSISMDITPKGRGKGQVAHHLRKTHPDDKIIFFGDKTMPGGNDYELAHELSLIDNTQVVQVDGPEEVAKFLKI